ncbi:MAG: hypothetical protein QOH99_805, partial [Frankiaceae bacterium]|nr:hypothetical protein [Frankiaceae bacterium]
LEARIVQGDECAACVTEVVVRQVASGPAFAAGRQPGIRFPEAADEFSEWPVRGAQHGNGRVRGMILHSP